MNKKIFDYKVIQSTNLEKLKNEILELQGKGWRVQGGVSAMSNGIGSIMYFQSLVILA